MQWWEGSHGGVPQVGPGSPLVLTNTERLGNLLSKSMKDSPTKTVYGMSNYGKVHTHAGDHV